MTTLQPDLTAARRTNLSITTAPGRAQVRSRVTGRPDTPCLRPMILDAGPERARVALVPDGALLLAGDSIRLDVDVGPGARLDLVEPAGTVAFDMRGGEATWDVRITLAAGATLVWAGEPFVLAGGSRVHRSTSARLGSGARLCVRETLVLGRYAERGGSLMQTWTATDDNDEPLLVEHLILDESAHRPGVLGGNRSLGSVIALGFDVEASTCDEGRMDLEAGGAVWRRLAHETHAAVPGVTWQAVLDAC
ncbi:MAG: urease accessory protein UreD [Marmoricola sp.]